MLKILGNCPSCNAEDRIAEDRSEKENYSKVQCGNCFTVWNDYYKLLNERNSLEKRMIPVNIWRFNGSVELWCPDKDEVPHSSTIVSVLNSALLHRYNLNISYSCEGGIVQRKKGWRKYYELRNSYDRIGLSFEEGNINEAQKALTLYECLLEQLFQKPFEFARKRYRAGEILRLETSSTPSDALIYLFATLTTVLHRDFAIGTMNTLEDLGQSLFGVAHLRGLSDDEIARIFIHPPLS